MQYILKTNIVMKKIKLINCVVINHIKGSVEVAPFTNTDEAADFCNFVMSMEQSISEVFFGKKCEVEFDTDNQQMCLRNTTDDVVIVEINVDVRDLEINV